MFYLLRKPVAFIQNYYKIRVGDYRIGIKFEHETLTFERILHRKDIYKVFP